MSMLASNMNKLFNTFPNEFAYRTSFFACVKVCLKEFIQFKLPTYKVPPVIEVVLHEQVRRGNKCALMVFLISSLQLHPPTSIR